jgi:hypothetical protein
VQIKDVIVCDDIRSELANKFSLMGLYFNRIVIEPKGEAIKFPILLKLGLMIRLNGEDADAFPQDFEIKYLLNNQQIAKVEGRLELTNVRNKKELILPIVVNLPITGYGKLDFNLNFSKDQKETATFSNLYPLDIVDKI